MTIAEIIQIETARQESESWNVVHLLKEGDFYRAHDWSAWLMSVFPFGEALEKPLKVIAKKLKDGYIDAFLGFPASSLKKYLPEGTDFNVVSDTQIDVKVEIPAEIGEVSFDNLNGMKEAWKSNLPLQDKKQRREEREVSVQAPMFLRFTDVFNRIMALPMEDMSPMDAWNFLRDLRRQISAMY